MDNPRVLHIRETARRQFTEDEYYVGRGSQFGNPFVIGQHGTRQEVIEKFRKYFYSSGTLMDAARKELRGKDLVCFCAPESCHADILLEFANRRN